MLRLLFIYTKSINVTLVNVEDIYDKLYQSVSLIANNWTIELGLLQNHLCSILSDLWTVSFDLALGNRFENAICHVPFASTLLIDS